MGARLFSFPVHKLLGCNPCRSLFPNIRCDISCFWPWAWTGLIQPALKLMERLLFTSVSPFTSYCSPLAAPTMSLPLILAGLQALPKHHAFPLHTSTGRGREIISPSAHMPSLRALAKGQGAVHRQGLRCWSLPSCCPLAAGASSSTASSHAAALCVHQEPCAEFLRSLDVIPQLVMV